MFEFLERKKRRTSVVIMGIKAETVNKLRTVFSNICASMTGTHYDPDDVHCLNRDTVMFRVKIADLSARDDLILNTRKLKDLHQYKHTTKGRNSDLGGLPDVIKHIMSDPLQVPIVYLLLL